MGQVSVPVNGRSYAITCEDGQETRIRRLAQYVDAKVTEFVGRVGQAGEGRLLLLAALVIADELSDANDALEREERKRAETASNGRDETARQVMPIAAGAPTPPPSPTGGGAR